MKKTAIIVTAVLALQANILFAGNETTSVTVINENATSIMVFLAPSTPAEATFDDFVTVNDISSLMPVTPSEASFEEMPFETASFRDLAPSTPAVAEFEEAFDVNTIDVISLAPVNPVEADFE